jgi:hypothetical protein
MMKTLLHGAAMYLVQACQPVIDPPEGVSECPTRVLCVVVECEPRPCILSVLSMWFFYGSKVWDITIFRPELLWTARGEGTV